MPRIGAFGHDRLVGGELKLLLFDWDYATLSTNHATISESGSVMIFYQTTFIGIDPTAGQRPMAYAALDNDLQILALGEASLDEVTAFVGGQQAAFVAINGPRRPNQGLMKDEARRAALNPVPNPGRWEDFRVAEYLVNQHGIRMPRTPDHLSACPGWMQRGFELYQRLERLGFRDYPVEDGPCQVLEVYPHASYTVLLGLVPFVKDSLEGRLQRQLVLHNRGLEVADPMRVFEEITRYKLLQGILPLETIYAVPDLDALVAAYTAWVAAHHSEDVLLLGDPTEGQITLPRAELLSKY
ncbi:MAG: DUF429 domain-containing protein [Anaerolineales bacterium]|nr:DUF429 domain-containing protein [Anaerolineales bacterium]